MLTRRKRAASLSSNPDESDPEVKLTKLSDRTKKLTKKKVEKIIEEPVESDEEEKELESFLFGNSETTSDDFKNNEDTIMLDTIEEGSESEEEEKSDTEDEENTELFADNDTEEDIEKESAKVEKNNKLESETVDLSDILFVDKSGDDPNDPNKVKKARKRKPRNKNKDKNNENEEVNIEKDSEVEESKKKRKNRKKKSKNAENLSQEEGNDTVKSKKKRKIRKPKTGNESESDPEEERDLEEFLFGNTNQICEGDMNNQRSVSSDEEDVDGSEKPLLSFEICTKPTDVDFDVEQEKEEVPIIELGSKKEKPAWADPDDEQESVDIQNKNVLRKLRVAEDEKEVSGAVFQDRLRTNFEKVLPAPAWADMEKADSQSSDDEDHEEEKIFKTRKKLLAKPDQLMKGIISLKRLKDINRLTPGNSTISALKFHPSAKIALTASYSKNLSIYQIDGKDNQRLQSIHFEGFPVHTASFSPNGEKIYCTSRRKNMYIYDMLEGAVTNIKQIRGLYEKSLEKFVISPDGDIIAFLGTSGYIHLASMKTNHVISSIKMNGKVHAATFSPDSSRLYSAGRDGEAYIWDIKSRRCIHRFVDEGSLRSTTIAVPNNGQYVALGSTSGVVNVYDDKCFTEKSPAPLKAIMNLTTSIAGTVFNPTSEILACYSPQTRNGLKLIHLPSLTTFSNWPIEKQTLGNVSAIDFSPKSGYMGIGNENGKALLFRLSHYPDS